jgi:hypothetical protein
LGSAASRSFAHHVTGNRTGRELLSMRILDAAIHGWDLARAIGADETLHDHVVAFLLAYTADLDLGPQQRAFAVADAAIPRNASLQDHLLHRLGRLEADRHAGTGSSPAATQRR